MNFWQKLVASKKPILGLSPMDGVTDAPFRYMVAKYGGNVNPKSKIQNNKQITNSKSKIIKRENEQPGVDVIYTEFVSVDALHHTRGTDRYARVMRALTRARDIERKCLSAPVSQYSSGEQKLQNCKTAKLRHSATKWPYEVAQIFGSNPELFVEAAEYVESLGFDGIDINMGCPAKKVSENGAGAGLIRTPAKAREIIRATKSATSLPVSVKTRIGVESVSEMDEWITILVEEEPAIITLHGRTLRQMYTGKSDWEAIERAGEIVHSAGIGILGNGDVESAIDAKEKSKKYGVDGVLIGRASFGNPGIFAGIELTKKQRLKWMVEHAKMFEKHLECPSGSVGQCLSGEQRRKNFLPMRKHLAWYARGFPGASELRQRLVRCSSVGEVKKVIEGFGG